MSTPTIEPHPEAAPRPDGATVRQRQIAELLDRRQDLRGISELGEVLQHGLRWSV